MATSITAAAATALILFLLIPLSADPVRAPALVCLTGLAGCAVNPVVTALAMRFAGDAPTRTSAPTTSAFNTGVAAGTATAGAALDSALRLTGPLLVGTVITAPTLLPLIVPAVHSAPGASRIVARRPPSARSRNEEFVHDASHHCTRPALAAG